MGNKLFCLDGSKFLCIGCDTHLLTAAKDIFFGEYIDESLFISASVKAKNGSPMICPECNLAFNFYQDGLNVKIQTPSSTPTPAANG